MSLPELIEVHRDRSWRRDPELRVDGAQQAEQFVEEVGFCTALTDARLTGPSLFIAVCGRRDAHMPRNVQKDPESRLAWYIKDEVMKRGRCFYGKVLKTHSTFIAARLLPAFVAVLGVPRRMESSRLSPDALLILKALRKEWEMGTKDLREASGVLEKAHFDRAMVQLQKALKIIPVDVVYQPTFSYIWSIPETRFNQQFEEAKKVSREAALTEIARAYLGGAGLTMRGELARFTGLGSPDAGLGNWGLVDEGFADRLGPGIYRLRELQEVSFRVQRGGRV